MRAKLHRICNTRQRLPPGLAIQPFAPNIFPTILIFRRIRRLEQANQKLIGTALKVSPGISQFDNVVIRQLLWEIFFSGLNE